MSLLESETKNLTPEIVPLVLINSRLTLWITSGVLLLDLLVILCKCSIDMEEGHLRLNTILHRLTCFWDLSCRWNCRWAANPDADLRFVEQLGTPNSVKKEMLSVSSINMKSGWKINLQPDMKMSTHSTLSTGLRN